MGKSMSTAKNVSRNTVKTVTTNPIVQQIPKPNPETIKRVSPVSTQPTADYLTKINSLDKSFNDRLKQVFVTSVDKNANLDLPKDTLPKSRSTPFTTAPHSQAPEKQEPYTLTVDDLKLMLVNHKGNPEKWTIEYIAARFDISKEIAGKLVQNYGTLETYFAKAPSESDKYLRREEPVKRIHTETSIIEMEEIMQADKNRKWKTLDEARRDFEKPT